MTSERLLQDSFLLRVKHGSTMSLCEEVRKLNTSCWYINDEVLESICQLLEKDVYLFADDYVNLVLKVKNKSFYEKTIKKMHIAHYPDALHQLLIAGIPDPNIEDIIINNAFMYFQKGNLDVVRRHLQAIIEAGTKLSLPILKVMKFEITPKYDVAKVKKNVADKIQEEEIQVDMDFWIDIANAKLDFRTGYLIDAAIAAVRYTSSNPSPHWFEWIKQ